MILLPFCGRIDAETRALWLAHLNGELAQLGVEVCPLADLPPEARAVAEVAIVANPDPAELRLLPNLRWVQSLWAGVERIVSELEDMPLTIVRLEDPQLAATMAEAVLAATLYLHRDMPRYARQQAQRVWQQHTLPLARERTIGLLGFGNLGRVAGERLVANGFTVEGWSRSGGSHPAIPVRAGEAGLEALLRTADILVVLLPLTVETRELLCGPRLSAMKRGACIINFARGAIIEDEALLAALDAGQIGHALLDVFVTEPLPEAHPYWTHPAVTVWPHVSAPTTMSTASRIVAQNLDTFLREGVVPRGVDRVRGY